MVLILGLPYGSVSWMSRLRDRLPCAGWLTASCWKRPAITLSVMPGAPGIKGCCAAGLLKNFPFPPVFAGPHCQQWRSSEWISRPSASTERSYEPCRISFRVRVAFAPINVRLLSLARGRVGLLNGCVGVVFGETHQSTIQLIQAPASMWLFPSQQRCCGALHAHSGLPRPDLAPAQSRCLNKLITCVLANAVGCGSTLKEYDHLLSQDPVAERVSQSSGCGLFPNGWSSGVRLLPAGAFCFGSCR